MATGVHKIFAVKNACKLYKPAFPNGLMGSAFVLHVHVHYQLSQSTQNVYIAGQKRR
jgi:hypothetical protein